MPLPALANPREASRHARAPLPQHGGAMWQGHCRTGGTTSAPRLRNRAAKPARHLAPPQPNHTRKHRALLQSEQPLAPSRANANSPSGRRRAPRSHPSSAPCGRQPRGSSTSTPRIRSLVELRHHSVRRQDQRRRAATSSARLRAKPPPRDSNAHQRLREPKFARAHARNHKPHRAVSSRRRERPSNRAQANRHARTDRAAATGRNGICASAGTYLDWRR